LYVKSDHLEQSGPCLSCAAEACQFYPDYPTYDPASLLAGQISDSCFNSNDECSKSDPQLWTDSWNGAPQGYVGVVYGQPIDSALYEGSFIETLSAEPYGFLDYPNSDPFTTPVHVPQNNILSDFCQYTEEVSTRNSQSHVSPDSFFDIIQHPSTAPGSDSPDPEQASIYNPSPSSSFSTPSVNSAIQSAKPLDGSHVRGRTLDGKRKIDPTRPALLCEACKKTFLSSLRYRQHGKHGKCQALYRCQNCSERFKHAKDLTRHLGGNKAAPSCPELKANGARGKLFACTCNKKAYTRKDTLQRHMNKGNTRNHQQQQHQCNACGCCRCIC
jgi:hypothetical protein